MPLSSVGLGIFETEIDSLIKIPPIIPTLMIPSIFLKCIKKMNKCLVKYTYIKSDAPKIHVTSDISAISIA